MTTSPGIVFKVHSSRRTARWPRIASYNKRRDALRQPVNISFLLKLLVTARQTLSHLVTASEPVTTTRSGVTRSSVDKEELLSCVTERHEPGPTITQAQLEKSTQSRWQSPEALGRPHLRCIQRRSKLAMFTMSRPPIRSSPSRSSRDGDDILFVIQNAEDMGNE
ncbi:hypothetical protein FOMG_19614 [Fusarium oxysporum f. sp. melonis 26406]|uniref:Uncharacterized protein n=1 Tax=Fusarium oxysporum f. sp. melonis 26406 TaxID=1089452 RepID=W9YWT6_FUSOX|nr:hypothetical protein FOMG_19614 [Fusarium oxysporum f. sp. melonis 26406]